jgi:hypothetical protein
MEEEGFFEEEEDDAANGRGRDCAAMSDANSCVSDVEGSDPEDENVRQMQSIATALHNLTRDKTRRHYKGGVKAYKVSSEVPLFLLFNHDSDTPSALSA